MNLLEIGYFQFNNLVENRVGFCLLLVDGEFPNLYEGVYETHLRTCLFPSSPERALEDLQLKKIPNDFGIVVVCSDGQIAESIAKKLFEQAYKNTYFLSGGIKGLTEFLEKNRIRP